MNRRSARTLPVIAAGIALVTGACAQPQSDTGEVARGNAAGYPDRAPAEASRPDGFVDLATVAPGIDITLRYFGNDNFVGRRVAGYRANVAYLTVEAASALAGVQRELAVEGFGLRVFDAYRPQRAVDDFVAWAGNPDDTATKPAYYPYLDKGELIPRGYIAPRSGHSRGSTVDLTLIDLESGEALDMGSPYDFFDPVSWPMSTAVDAQARSNRMRLREVMLRHGFEPLDEEWWHFTLRDEPYPATYFDFIVR